MYLGFAVLWRMVRVVMIAPGQPPTSSIEWSDFSGILRLFRAALRLSAMCIAALTMLKTR